MAIIDEIIKYKGNPVAGGGFSENDANNISEMLLKTGERFHDAIQNMKLFEFQIAQLKYEQKIKERDEMVAKLENEELITNMDDEDRKAILGDLEKFQNDYLEKVKKSKNGTLSDTDVIELANKYRNIKALSTVAQARKLIMDTDEAEINGQYSSSYITKPKRQTTKSGQQQQDVSIDTPMANIDFQKKHFDEHWKTEKEKMKADRFYIPKPFVPVQNFDYDKMFPGAQTIIEENKQPSGKTIYKSKVDFGKTQDYFKKMWENPYEHAQMESAIKNIYFLNPDTEKNEAIDAANERLKIIFPDDESKRIPKDPQLFMAKAPYYMALLNYQKDFDSKEKNKTWEGFKSKTDEFEYRQNIQQQNKEKAAKIEKEVASYKSKLKRQEKTHEVTQNIRQAKEISKIKGGDSNSQTQVGGMTKADKKAYAKQRIKDLAMIDTLPTEAPPQKPNAQRGTPEYNKYLNDLANYQKKVESFKEKYKKELENVLYGREDLTEELYQEVEAILGMSEDETENPNNIIILFNS
jgi:hypothetical protein